MSLLRFEHESGILVNRRRVSLSNISIVEHSSSRSRVALHSWRRDCWGIGGDTNIYGGEKELVTRLMI